MNRLVSLFVLAGACLAACDDSTNPDVPLAHVQWQVSAETCEGSSRIVFSVDGTAIASETLVAGQSSLVYDVEPGDHFISAREDFVGGLVWDEVLPVTFFPGDTIVRVLDCL